MSAENIRALVIYSSYLCFRLAFEHKSAEKRSREVERERHPGSSKIQCQCRDVNGFSLISILVAIIFWQLERETWPKGYCIDLNSKESHAITRFRKFEKQRGHESVVVERQTRSAVHGLRNCCLLGLSLCDGGNRASRPHCFAHSSSFYRESSPS